MYSGNVQQNPLCVESCFTKEYSISPGSRQRYLILMQVQYSYDLYTAVDSMRRKPWVRNWLRERKGLYNGYVRQNPLCAASCFTNDIPSLPGSRQRFFIAGLIQHRTVLHRFLYTPAQVDAPMYSSRLYAKNPVFEIVYEESVKVYHLYMFNGNIQQNSLCVESCVTEGFHISPQFSLHLRLPAAVAELAVYAVDEHHAGAVLLFSVRYWHSVMLDTEYDHYEKEHTAHF